MSSSNPSQNQSHNFKHTTTSSHPFVPSTLLHNTYVFTPSQLLSFHYFKSNASSQLPSLYVFTTSILLCHYLRALIYDPLQGFFYFKSFYVFTTLRLQRLCYFKVSTQRYGFYIFTTHHHFKVLLLLILPTTIPIHLYFFTSCTTSHLQQV